MHILGLSFFYHDSAAALIRDGEIVAAAAEERFTRQKHTADFPEQAVRYCLREAGITSQDLGEIVFYEKPLVKFDRILECVIATWPFSYGQWLRAMPRWLGSRLHIARLIRKRLGVKRKPIMFCRHHLSHAASAFFLSPFERAAVLTVDGVGEWETTTLGRGVENRLELEYAQKFPHSIGLLYSAITSYLGFRVNDAEWKVMGLAPYGSPTLLEKFRRLVDVKKDGSFRLDLDYFSYHRGGRWMFSRKFQRLFGESQRFPEDSLTDFHRDFARSGQALIEEVLLKIAVHLRRLYGERYLCIGGGVGLNSVANWRIFEEAGFDDVFIQPAAGDDGGSLGAALFVHHCVFKRPRCPSLKHVYTGPGYTEEEIEQALREAGARFRTIKDDSRLVEETVRLLEEEKVIGWYQGRMEFGPRALGNRSILASPRREEMKAIINAKVKYREAFRPFAPAIVWERASEFFDFSEGMDLPYMLLVPQVRPEKRALIPAVTHQDGSGRVQTVRREINPLFHEVIQRFGERTGVPVLLNTSFNVRGEPIVNTPREAYHCFLNTGIDALVIGHFLVEDKPKPVDVGGGMSRSVRLEQTVDEGVPL